MSGPYTIGSVRMAKRKFSSGPISDEITTCGYMTLIFAKCTTIMIAELAIKLTTPDRKGLEYVAKSVVIAKGVSNRVKLNPLDTSQGPKVPMFTKFSDVLPEKLSVVPPDRDIEIVNK
jgi:hypothetical protein